MDVIQSTKGTVIVNTKINTALVNARKEAGLKQWQVAKEAKISERVYQRYEAGDRIPRADIAKLIARALNSTVEELF